MHTKSLRDNKIFRADSRPLTEFCLSCFRGDATSSGAHQTFDPGHAPEVAWYLPDEAAEEFAQGFTAAG
jgi:hypothetical protein